MIGPQLQAAIYDALTAANVAGGRVYDRPPEHPEFPYVTIGDAQVIPDGAGDNSGACVGGWECFEDVHVWSRPVTGSKAQVKAIAAGVVPAMIGIDVIDDYVVLVANLDSSRTFRDPDGITEHAVMTFRYLLSPAN